MFSSFMEFQVSSPLLSETDLSTLALAVTDSYCAERDDSLMVTICKEYGIKYIKQEGQSQARSDIMQSGN